MPNTAKVRTTRQRVRHAPVVRPADRDGELVVILQLDRARGLRARERGDSVAEVRSAQVVAPEIHEVRGLVLKDSDRGPVHLTSILAEQTFLSASRTQKFFRVDGVEIKRRQRLPDKLPQGARIHRYTSADRPCCATRSSSTRAKAPTE